MPFLQHPCTILQTLQKGALNVSTASTIDTGGVEQTLPAAARIRKDSPWKSKSWAPATPICKKTKAVIADAVKEMHLNFKVIEVQDIPSIMAYGVMSTPAIVIDAKVVSTGKVPAKSQVMEMIRKAQAVSHKLVGSSFRCRRAGGRRR